MPLFSAGKLVASISAVHVLTGAAPDLCKTPMPPAPVPPPIPYPNIAVTATPGPGYATKTLVLATPAYTKNSACAISNGMQPGVALGVVSSKIMGMAHATMCSTDVSIEGGDVVRSFDKGTSNG